MKRVGIRGYKVIGEGIVYAPNGREALRKVGEDLIRASEDPDIELNEVKSFVRGQLQFIEIETMVVK